MNKPKRTEINEIGEFGLIERLKKNIQITNPQTVKGIGDDAAVYDLLTDYLLISTDMLLEGVHFDLSYVPLEHLGYKSIAINVSDIAAMNGIPQQVIVGLGLSNRFSVEAIEKLYQGIQKACEDYGTDLVGGDTTSSQSGLVISVTATGRVDKKRITHRNSATVHDILCVTGDLGGAYCGLQILEREKQEFLVNPEMQPQLQSYEFVVGRQLKPKARTDIVHELQSHDVIPTSMIDISDGLASEIFHICTQSNLGVSIFEDKLPIDTKTHQVAKEFGINPSTCALNGGEDYELLFTINQKDFEKLKNHPDIHTIGYMQTPEKGKKVISESGNQYDLKAQGWQHFTSQS